VLVIQTLAAAEQAWPPFVLVAGLLLIGAAVDADGIFEAIGGRLARAPLSPRVLLLALLALVAGVTAVLNLDTAVVFLTPVLVHVARRRGLDERPFLYGTVFMANAASLLLPGSNLTHLLVAHADRVDGGAFALSMLPAWIASCCVTAAFVSLAFRLDPGHRDDSEAPPLRLGVGAAAALAAAAVVIALPNPALPVLALGLAAVTHRRLRPRLDVRMLALLFAFAVGLGALGRQWNAPAHMLSGSGQIATAAVAAVGSTLLNNLPAALLFAAHPSLHPRALLLGLDVGPNLAVTGSLSALLWLQAARAVDAAASIVTYTRLGVLLVPLTLAASLPVLS